MSPAILIGHSEVNFLSDLVKHGSRTSRENGLVALHQLVAVDSSQVSSLLNDEVALTTVL